MKKRLILFLIFFNILFLVSCDPYVNRHPTNYKNSKWVCTDPNIVYYVGYFENDIYDYAEVNIDGEVHYFGFGFNSTTADGIKYDIDENGNLISTGKFYFNGTGKYSKKSFTVIIDKKTDILFHGKYDKLVFKRVIEVTKDDTSSDFDIKDGFPIS